MSTLEPRRTRSGAWSTRDLMVLIAMALVFGLILTGFSYVFALATAVLTPALASAVFGGLWILPTYMMAYILRRPGTALLTTLLYNLIQVPLSPYGLAVMIGAVISGVIYELPFLLTGYRRHGLPLLMPGAALANLATVVVSALIQGGANLALGLWVVIVVVALLSGALGAWLGTLLADALARTGVLGNTAIGQARIGEI